MAAAPLSSATSLLPPPPPRSSSSPSSSSSSFGSPVSVSVHASSGKRRITVCGAVGGRSQSLFLSRRSLPICLTAGFLLANTGSSGGAILEADDDLELLERVKKDRKKRLERQEVINSSNKEKAYLQDLIYKLLKVGQAIDNKDLSAAGSVLGSSIDTDWVQKANIAFTKLSLSPEEKTEVDQFNSSLASLVSSVVRNDFESSKMAFVSSAVTLEKWTTLTGLTGQLKGL